MNKISLKEYLEKRIKNKYLNHNLKNIIEYILNNNLVDGIYIGLDKSGNIESSINTMDNLEMRLITDESPINFFYENFYKNSEHSKNQNEIGSAAADELFLSVFQKDESYNSFVHLLSKGSLEFKEKRALINFIVQKIEQYDKLFYIICFLEKMLENKNPIKFNVK